MLDSGEACVPGTQKQPDMGEQEQRKATNHPSQKSLTYEVLIQFICDRAEFNTNPVAFVGVCLYLVLRHMRHNDLWDVVHRLVYCPIAKVQN